MDAGRTAARNLVKLMGLSLSLMDDVERASSGIGGRGSHLPRHCSRRDRVCVCERRRCVRARRSRPTATKHTHTRLCTLCF